MSIVQARWALWLREHNDQLDADRQLEQFLYGPTRAAASVYAERLHRLQGGRCFYTGVHLSLSGARAGEVDHFIPGGALPV